MRKKLVFNPIEKLLKENTSVAKNLKPSAYAVAVGFGSYKSCKNEIIRVII